MHVGFLHGHLPWSGCDNGSPGEPILKRTWLSCIHKYTRGWKKRVGIPELGVGFGWHFLCQWREKSATEGHQIEFHLKRLEKKIQQKSESKLTVTLLTS